MSEIKEVVSTGKTSETQATAVAKLPIIIGDVQMMPTVNPLTKLETVVPKGTVQSGKVGGALYYRDLNGASKEELREAVRQCLIAGVMKAFGVAYYRGEKLSQFRISVNGNAFKHNIPEVIENQTIPDYIAKNDHAFTKEVDRVTNALADVTTSFLAMEGLGNFKTA